MHVSSLKQECVAAIFGSDVMLCPKELTRRLPRQANGKAVSLCAMYRWMQRGIRGRRLRWIECGRTRYITRSAWEEFVTESTPAGEPGASAPTPAARRREIEAAARQVEAILNPHNTNHSAT